MSLIGSAKMNDLDPYAYLKDVLERLPTHPARCPAAAPLTRAFLGSGIGVSSDWQ
jgi:hypothetical protein